MAAELDSVCSWWRSVCMCVCITLYIVPTWANDSVCCESPRHAHVVFGSSLIGFVHCWRHQYILLHVRTRAALEAAVMVTQAERMLIFLLESTDCIHVAGRVHRNEW